MLQTVVFKVCIAVCMCALSTLAHMWACICILRRCNGCLAPPGHEFHDGRATSDSKWNRASAFVPDVHTVSNVACCPIAVHHSASFMPCPFLTQKHVYAYPGSAIVVVHLLGIIYMRLGNKRLELVSRFRSDRVSPLCPLLSSMIWAFVNGVCALTPLRSK